jgi:hypothetical protein
MRKLTTTVVLLTLLLPGLPVIAQTQQNIQLQQMLKNQQIKGVDSYDDLMRERRAQIRIINATIDQGGWSGLATGLVDKNLRQNLGPNVVKSVYLETKVIGHFSDQNCKRIQYHYTMMTTKTKEPQEIGEIKLNQCRDGAQLTATPEEIYRVENNMDINTALIQAKVTPFTDEEEKNQMTQMQKKAIQQPGQTISEPLEDPKILKMIRDVSDHRANVVLTVTALKELPQSGCARIKVEVLADMPYKMIVEPTYGYFIEMNACEHGNHSLPMPSAPVLVSTKPPTKSAKQNTAPKPQAGVAKAVVTPAPAQAKAPPTKPPALSAAKPTSSTAQGKK